MEWFDTFAANLKDFWSQPVPIIGFTVGTCIIGFCFIFAKTSLGKKALNKLQKLYDDLVAKYKEIVDAKLLDLKLDVLQEEQNMGLNLLEKTELWVNEDENNRS